MPMAMHTNKKFRLVLECDKACDPQPCFIFPYLTGLQQEELIELHESIEGNDHRGNYEKTYAAATKYMVGWEHMTDADGKEIPFDLSRIKEFVSLMEAMEIINKLLMQQNLDLQDKKK